MNVGFPLKWVLPCTALLEYSTLFFTSFLFHIPRVSKRRRKFDVDLMQLHFFMISNFRNLVVDANLIYSWCSSRKWFGEFIHGIRNAICTHQCEGSEVIGSPRGGRIGSGLQ